MDDFSLSVASSSPRKNCRLLREIAIELFHEATLQQAPFNHSKTELIHFSRKRETPTDPVILPGLTVQPSAIVRWLGVWLDSKLTFKAHIEKRINLATAAFYRAQRLQKGLGFRALRQLYRACVTTIADYGAPVWWKGQAQGTALGHLQRLQNLATTAMLGAYRGSPHKALELEAAVYPPEVRLEKACNLYAVRTLRFQKNHPVKQALRAAVRDELAGSNTDSASDGNQNTRYIRPSTQLFRLQHRALKLVGPYGLQRVERCNGIWTAPWKEPLQATITISALSKPKAAHEHARHLQQLHQQAHFQPTYVYYTDGSKEGSATGASVVQLGAEGTVISTASWNTGPWIEVADAETTAVKEALQQALRGLQVQPPPPDPPEIHIFVDSQAAIQRLQSYGSATVQQAKATTQKLIQQYNAHIYITWCPSHKGINGNEIADQQAKLALRKPISPKAQVSVGYLRGLVRRKAAEQWHHIHQQPGVIGLGKHYSRVVRDSTTFAAKPHKALRAFTKRSLSAYIQLKTGIGGLKTHLYTVKKATSNRCNRCYSGKSQTTAHLLLYCSAYIEERKDLRRALRGLPLSLHTLFCTKIGRRALASYINSTGVCTTRWSENRAEEA
jgi:ribonuclease HI